jgi:hypothetical protein
MRKTLGLAIAIALVASSSTAARAARGRRRAAARKPAVALVKVNGGITFENGAMKRHAGPGPSGSWKAIELTRMKAGAELLAAEMLGEPKEAETVHLTYERSTDPGTGERTVTRIRTHANHQKRGRPEHEDVKVVKTKPMPQWARSEAERMMGHALGPEWKLQVVVSSKRRVVTPDGIETERRTRERNTQSFHIIKQDDKGRTVYRFRILKDQSAVAYGTGNRAVPWRSEVSHPGQIGGRP